MNQHSLRTRTEETAPEEPLLEAEPSAFRPQGQWVAVSYDDRFYTGQVVHVINKDKATVNYLEQTSGRSDYFKWPRVGDLVIQTSGAVGDLVIQTSGAAWRKQAVGEKVEELCDKSVREKVAQCNAGICRLCVNQLISSHAFVDHFKNSCARRR